MVRNNAIAGVFACTALSFVALGADVPTATTAPAATATTRAALAAQTLSPAQQRDARAAFYHRIVREDYDRVGRRDPSWDDDAHAMLDAFAETLGRDCSPDGDEYDVMIERARRLKESGCTDPVVLYASAKAFDFFGKGYKDIAPLYIEAAKRLNETRYHPVLRATAAFEAAEFRARDRSDVRAARREGRRLSSAGLATAAEALSDPQLPTAAVVALFDAAHDASALVERDRAVTFDAVFPMLQDKCAPQRAGFLLPLVRAQYAWDRAMDVRRDLRDAPDDPKLKDLLTERVADTERSARQAWSADPTDPTAAVLGMRAAAESNAADQVRDWFERAVEVDPDSLPVYAARLELLDPSRGNGSAEMLDFARMRCATNRTLGNGIAMLLVEAHLRASCFKPDGTSADAPQESYFATDPKVWEDIRSVYVPYLAQFDKSVFHRSRFAQIALWCGKRDISREQLRLLGDQWSVRWFRSKDAFRHFERHVLAP